MNKRILLIGRNPNVLANLGATLADEGYQVKTTGRIEHASQEFNGADFDGVAFGRGVDEQTNARLRAEFSEQNEKIIFIDGLAPVIPLLVKQIKLTLADVVPAKKVLIDFNIEPGDRFTINVTVGANCRLTITLYQLDAIHKTQADTLVSEAITSGKHRFLLNFPLKDSTIRFVAAEINDSELAVLAL